MKKYLNYIVTFLVVTILMISPINISADSGFDSDYDSGSSWDSDYDWDYDYDYDWDYDYGYDNDYSYSSGSGVDTIELIIVLSSLIVIIVLPVIIWVIYCKFLKAKNKTIEKVNIGNKIIKFEKLPKIENEKLKEELFNIYKNVQIAWMNMDLEPVRSVLTDEMYNMYKMQLMTLKNKSQKNMMEKIEFVDARLIKNYKAAGKETLEIVLKVTCKDYIINTKTNKVVRGNKNVTHIYIYKLTFVKNNNIDYTKCPNCGSKLEGSSSKCPYCRSTIIHESNEYVLAKKKMLKQGRK